MVGYEQTGAGAGFRTQLRRREVEQEAQPLVFGDGAQARTIHQVSRATLREAQAYFAGLRLSGAKADIADKVVREIAARLKFLNDVGLDYLSLERSERRRSSSSSS